MPSQSEPPVLPFRTPVRVLLVDDEDGFRDTLAKVLTRRGMEVSAASDGEEGLRLLGSEYFDVALLDLRMPGLDGLTALRRARELSPQTRVVILTGYGTVEAVIEALRRQAFDFLEKPVSIGHLVEVIEKAARVRRAEEAKGAGP